jgi:hypothetical protein
MQQNKVTNNNSELQILAYDSEKLTSSLTEGMKKFNVKKHTQIFDFLKCKGIAVSSLLNILIILPFYGIANVCQLMRCGIQKQDIEGKKTSFYDVKNNEFIDWRKLLMLHVKRFIYLINNNINLKSLKITALVFDDTLIEKTGKKIEKVSIVNDHVSGKFIFGFKLLVCGFWDGDSFIPIDFTLHREKGKKQEKFIKEYQKSVKNVETQRNKIKKIQISNKKNIEKLSNNNTKYQIKSNKINKLSYKKSEEKAKKTENQLTENQKILLQLEVEKKIAYKNYKRNYSSNSLFGLTEKERKAQFKKAVSTKSHGFRRRKEADKSKIYCMLEMLCRAVKKGIIPQYVITDSWFFCFELLEKLRVLKKGAIKLVSMVKINNQIFTICQTNKDMSVKNIIKTHERKSQKCKKLKAEYIRVNSYYKEIRVNLYFVRMGKCKTWHLLITTDLELTFIKLMEIYQIRWSIEVFFKESKQYLHLSDCQSNTFDAQIADITISMMQNIMLSYFKRVNYQQSIGGLFEAIKHELVELDLVTRLIKIFWELAKLFCMSYGIDFIDFQQYIMKDADMMIKIQKLFPEKIIDKVA